ncbi:hypothetical protein GBAR_LOCUS9158, partial [Geodia barretti]
MWEMYSISPEEQSTRRPHHPQPLTPHTSPSAPSSSSESRSQIGSTHPWIDQECIIVYTVRG